MCFECFKWIRAHLEADAGLFAWFRSGQAEREKDGVSKRALGPREGTGKIVRYECLYIENITRWFYGDQQQQQTHRDSKRTSHNNQYQTQSKTHMHTPKQWHIERHQQPAADIHA